MEPSLNKLFWNFNDAKCSIEIICIMKKKINMVMIPFELNVHHDNGIYHLIKQENLFNKNDPQWY